MGSFVSALKSGWEVILIGAAFVVGVWAYASSNKRAGRPVQVRSIVRFTIGALLLGLLILVVVLVVTFSGCDSCWS